MELTDVVTAGDGNCEVRHSAITSCRGLTDALIGYLKVLWRKVDLPLSYDPTLLAAGAQIVSASC